MLPQRRAASVTHRSLGAVSNDWRVSNDLAKCGFVLRMGDPLAHSSSGLGHHPLKVEIAGSNPAGDTCSNRTALWWSATGVALGL